MSVGRPRGLAPADADFVLAVADLKLPNGVALVDGVSTAVVYDRDARTIQIDASGGVTPVADFEAGVDSAGAVSSFDLTGLTALDSMAAWLLLLEVYNPTGSATVIYVYLGHTNPISPTYDSTLTHYYIQTTQGIGSATSSFRNNNPGVLAVAAGETAQCWMLFTRYEKSGTRYTGGLILGREREGANLRLNFKSFDSSGLSTEPLALRIDSSVASAIGVGSRGRVIELG